MHIRKMASALAIAVPASLQAGPAVPSSPLGSEPAVIHYLSNDAPFVVFDVSPRSVTGPPDDFRQVTLTFIATDALPQLYVFAYVTSTREGTTQMAPRVDCGNRDHGYWSCTIPARELLDGLAQGDGLLGLRIEAEGMERDHSTVVITLPVKVAASQRPAPTAPPVGTPAPAMNTRTLTPLSAWMPR
jgi:hypothetical protein